MSDFAQLGVGGCIAILVLDRFIAFAKLLLRKREGNEHMNGDSPEHRQVEAFEVISRQSEIQTQVLKEMRELTGNNSRLLVGIDAKLDVVRQHVIN
jgi:hypothetical protein